MGSALFGDAVCPSLGASFSKARTRRFRNAGGKLEGSTQGGANARLRKLQAVPGTTGRTGRADRRLRLDLHEMRGQRESRQKPVRAPSLFSVARALLP
jgi:hypothetical protein